MSGLVLLFNKHGVFFVNYKTYFMNCNDVHRFTIFIKKEYFNDYNNFNF